MLDGTGHTNEAFKQWMPNICAGCGCFAKTGSYRDQVGNLHWKITCPNECYTSVNENLVLCIRNWDQNMERAYELEERYVRHTRTS